MGSVLQTGFKSLPKVPDSCDPLKVAAENGEILLHTFARGTYPGAVIPDGILKGIKSIGYWDAQNEQNWGLPFHRNEGIEITFLETGILNFEVRNEKFVLYPGAITITRPWIEHKLGSPLISRSKLHWLILDVGVSAPHQTWKWPEWIILTAGDLEMLTIFLRQTKKFVCAANKAIGDAFIQIGHISQNKELFEKESELRLLINNIFINLLETFKKGTFPLDETLTEAKRTVEFFIEDLNNTYNHPWTLDLMASYCHLGKTCFSVFFKELTNLSPIEYLNRIRIEKSIEMLKRDNVRITDIAYSAGFSSVHYFSNVFRKINGASPREFQNNFFLGSKNISPECIRKTHPLLDAEIPNGQDNVGICGMTNR